MKSFVNIISILLMLFICSAPVFAGPYAGALGYSESIPNPDATDVGIPGFVGPDGDGKCLSQGPNNYVNPVFVGWATGWVNYLPSDDTWSSDWDNPARALGPVTGDHFDIVSLGDLDSTEIAGAVPPGEITLTFDQPICDGEGADFAVFENTLVSLFTTGDGSVAEEIHAELGYVEVSTDGVNFLRFPCDSLTPEPFGSALYLTIDPTDITNLAGKHANQGGESWGTPFDLSELAGESLVLEGTVDLNEIHYVRIIDIPGSGDFSDATGDPIYDAWLTVGSGGLDLEALGIINTPGWLEITSVPEHAYIFIDGEDTGKLTGGNPLALPAGSYSLSIRASGHSPYEDVVTITPGSTVFIQAELSLNPGDANGDGKVDFADFILLKSSYGISLGEPGYNPDADLDGSDKVDFADFTILKTHYGEG
ncbi:MAG: PEGA domain-containing protein [Planctomycetes bacterium]|nr:PEGA domain-containing protein [Planctomycetota bacterium]